MEKAIYQVEWRCTVSMEKVKLKDICRLINGRAYKQEELLDSGKYPVLRVGNFFSDKVFYYSDLELEEDKYCDNGDLLFAWSASFGPKIWDGEKVIYHYHIWKMELTDRVNKEFLFYYLFHLSERIKSEGHGGIMIHTTKAEMEEREFNLPTLEEQIAISEILNKVMSVIDKRKEELSVLDDLIKARFVEMFANWKKKYLAEPLGEYLQDITYGFTNPMPDAEEGPWKITAKDVVNGIVNLDTARKTLQESYDKLTEKSKPQLGDVLLTKDGTLGRTAVVEIEGMCVNQSVAVLRINEKILPKYLSILLQMPKYQRDMIADAGGGTIKHIYITKVVKMPIVVPSIEEQNTFLDFVNQVDKSKVAVQKALEQTQTLFDSLMQKYFG